MTREDGVEYRQRSSEKTSDPRSGTFGFVPRLLDRLCPSVNCLLSSC
ncbi:Uncharacterized protein BM_BM18180 [Brugia malayi]|uniref:Uncharacterized protein n=1 Tax=Brugia malayi TaxID=6279 RepID=A0A4E9ESQ4_BRUMA|nr:Uncharacterized protein BM_BM18180 [Brugia malayi]VIO86840.1 Uncharacterized protein BM_BM18180 [Brugia malayi]